jgi:hypothetical protein
MERRGIRTEHGDINRSIAVTNQQLGQLRARINKLKNWIYAQPIQDAPSMVELMSAINGGQNLKSRWKKIADLKTRSKVLIFLQENNITDMGQLAETVTRYEHCDKYYKLREDVRSMEVLRRGAESILREGVPERTSTRGYDMGL